MISFDKNRTKATTSFCHLSKIDIVLFSTKYIDILNPLQNQRNFHLSLVNQK